MESGQHRDLGREILSGLGGIRERRADPYAGAERGNAGRVVAIVLALSAVLILVFLPIDPPTEAVGSAGWAVAGVIVAASFGGAAWVLRRDPPLGFVDLLVISYLGLVQVGLMQWLAGGPESEYGKLLFLWIATGMGMHPPARALTFLLVAGIVAFAPLAYDGWDGSAAAEITTNFMLWAALGGILLGLAMVVRSQRLRLQEGEEEAQQLARADALTGLGNRRAFDEALESEVARARRAGSTMSVALVDLDGFKDLNDRFGHLEGDRCLKQVTAAIKRALRGGDRGFRWGGDEFSLVLPDTSFAGAEEALDRVASEVMNGASDPDGRSMTVSWGIAELSKGVRADELLAQADLALMGHKRRKSAAERSEPLSE